MELAQMHQYLFILTTYVSAIMCTSWRKVGSKFPTALGTTLIKGYQYMDPDLCLPDIHSFNKHHITLVAKGLADHFRVVQHVLQQFRQKYRRVLSKYGKCLGYMKHMSTQPSRLYCM